MLKVYLLVYTSLALCRASYTFFLARLQEVLEANHYILGIFKGPFFAVIIAATGCIHGFRVTSDTESIGIETTASVVHAIFIVIACDALFSVIYTELGLCALR